MEFTKEQKQAMYATGEYVVHRHCFDCYTGNWSAESWIKAIDKTDGWRPRWLGNQQQMMAFAQLHDWGKDAVANNDGSITVHSNVHSLILGWSVESKRVSTMQELRDWAGY